nr:MAG TPA: hypothetical protein [Bacteriophage sp.]
MYISNFHNFMYITLLNMPIAIMYITIYNYVHNKETRTNKERTNHYDKERSKNRNQVFT